MAATSTLVGVPDRARKDTLADALARGPLALADALDYAVQLAVELRELHAADRTHGKVSVCSIVFKASGVGLLPGRLYFEEMERDTDVRGWGAVLYEMLTGAKPEADDPFGVPGLGGTRTGPSAIRPAAQRLAMKCLAPAPHVLPTIQQASSEVRLLALLARQYELRPEAPVSQTILTHTESAAPFLKTIQPPVAVAPPASPRAARLARLAEPVPCIAQPSTDPERLDESGGYAPTNFGQPANKKPAEPADKGSGPCPQCDASAIFISKPRSAFENMLVRWGVPIVRCHRCYHRWVVLGRLKIGKTMPTGPGRKKKVKRRGRK